METMISKYVSLKEVTYSQTAISNCIDNTPSDKQLSLIKDTAVHVYDPVREWVGDSVKINSIFRGPKLNKKIGGSNSSQHCVGLNPKLTSYGSAFDIDDTFKHKTNKEVFFFIKDNLEFDQLIYEFGTDNNADWVHFSYRGDGKNRKQVLRSIYVKNPKTGKTEVDYIPYI